ncbi:hypothetical protein GCM10027563_46100 [Parasphingorhabdus pacifica]
MITFAGSVSQDAGEGSQSTAGITGSASFSFAPSALRTPENQPPSGENRRLRDEARSDGLL